MNKGDLVFSVIKPSNSVSSMMSESARAPLVSPPSAAPQPLGIPPFHHPQQKNVIRNRCLISELC